MCAILDDETGTLAWRLATKIGNTLLGDEHTN